MQYLVYLFFRGFVGFVGLLPWRVLYLFSDLLYFIMANVIKYRKDVIERNLLRCFPEKSDAERHKIKKDFYVNFCDIIVEGIKGMGYPSAKLAKRFVIMNPAHVNDYLDKKQTTICSPAHYANWEWAVYTAGLLAHEQLQCIYKPIQNKYINDFIRERTRHLNIEMTSLKRTAEQFEHTANIATSFIMASDQSPSNMEKAIWVNFFDYRIPCLHGLEFYARKYNYPVLYADVRRVKRGYYELTLSTICESPATSNPGDVTQLYYYKLESIIREEPANWLWSHKRFKKIE